MEIKLVLSCAIIVCSTLVGCSTVWATGRRARLLGEILEALDMLEVRMISQLEPLERALFDCGCSFFDAVARGIAEGNSTQEAWKDAVRGNGRADCGVGTLHDAELIALDELFSKLGSTGKGTQAVLLARCTSILRREHEAAMQQAARSGKIHISIGALAGLMIAVLII